MRVPYIYSFSNYVNLNKYELHEQILIYLYQQRYTGNRVNLLPKFNDHPKKLIYDKVKELEAKKLIDVKYPFRGIGTFDWNTSKISFPHAEQEYIKAKLTNDGIDHVSSVILTSNKWLDLSAKFFTIVGVLATIFFGYHSLKTSEGNTSETILPIHGVEDSLNNVKTSKIYIQKAQLELDSMIRNSDNNNQ